MGGGRPVGDDMIWGSREEKFRRGVQSHWVVICMRYESIPSPVREEGEDNMHLMPRLLKKGYRQGYLYPMFDGNSNLYVYID